MLNSKTLMTYLLTLCVSFMMTACPDDECDTETAGDEMAEESAEEAGGDDACEEAGVMAGESAGETAGGDEGGDEAGAEAGTEVEVTAYNFVVVQDTTEDINNDGTPGVDICEIDIVCGGDPVSSVNVDVMPGSEACAADGSNSENCICDGSHSEAVCGSGTNRGNAEWLFDGDSSCEGDNWTSIGIDGYASLEVEGLADCASVDVTVTEKDGPNNESYIVALCDSAENLNYSAMMFGDSCAVIGSAETAGSNTFNWEAPVVEDDSTEDDSTEEESTDEESTDEEGGE